MGDGCRFQPLIFGSMLTQRFLLAYFLAQLMWPMIRTPTGPATTSTGNITGTFGGFLTGSSEGSLLNSVKLDSWISFQAALAAVISMISDGSPSLNRMIWKPGSYALFQKIMTAMRWKVLCVCGIDDQSCGCRTVIKCLLSWHHMEEVIFLLMLIVGWYNHSQL